MRIPGLNAAEFDLRLMSALNGVSRIPTVGKSLVVVAAVEQVLHFRIFDGDGKMVVDADEKRLAERVRRIEALRNQLERWWPPHELTGSEKGRVITAVTSIVGRTHVAVYCWPAARTEIEVEALPDAIDAALTLSGPGPKPDFGPGPRDLLDAYRWRCAWCEAVLRSQFGHAIRLSAAPWLDAMRIIPPEDHLQIKVRAQPPLYHIEHSRRISRPIFTETIHLDGPVDDDRQQLLTVTQFRPIPSLSQHRRRSPL
jgi:hypothetical protein